MELPRYRISRQRVCRQCAAAKAKCTLGFEGAPCGRCGKRGLQCSLAATKSSKGAIPTALDPRPTAGRWSKLGNPGATDVAAQLQQGSGEAENDLRAAGPVGSQGSSTHPAALGPRSLHSSDEPLPLDFGSLDLLCPIDAEGISNRWLNPYVPDPAQKAKTYDPTVTSFIHQSLKSYASIVVHDRGIPPFIHQLQLHSSVGSAPLRTCLNVIRLFERPGPDEDAAVDLLKREVDKLYERRLHCNAMDMIAAFQAYLIYSLVIYFWPGQSSDSTMVQLMMQLQELASIAAKQGIVCAAEEHHARPTWEAWVAAESKRRTMYTMYLFDGLLSARDGVPSFLGTELHSLSAPSCQDLWSCTGRRDWERKYNEFLAQWPEGYLTIDELWPTPQDFTAAAIARRQSRIDHWLENVDKFGTMLYAVTSYIHKN